MSSSQTLKQQVLCCIARATSVYETDDFLNVLLLNVQSVPQTAVPHLNKVNYSEDKKDEEHKRKQKITHLGQ